MASYNDRMEEGLGLRERKKRETRRRISDIATALFIERGFDNVTVAEIARAADVSVNTVFNYFRTKEDLFLDRQEDVVRTLSRTVREREPGETAVEAIRRDFLDALDTRHWRFGFNDGAEVFIRVIDASPSLQTRARALADEQERDLAATLAAETGADPEDLTPLLVAAQICAVVRVLADDFRRRRGAGETAEEIIPGLRERAERAFRAIESGVGPYARREPPAASRG